MSMIVEKVINPSLSVMTFTSPINQHQIYFKKIKSHPEVKAEKTFLLLHDLTGHHGRFNKLSHWLLNQKKPIDVVMLDFAGHGFSGGKRSHIEDFNNLKLDVLQMLEYLEKSAEEEWIILGQGLGGLVTLDLLGHVKIDKVILSNFILDYRSTIIDLQKKLVTRLGRFSSLVNGFKNSEIYLPPEMLVCAKEQSAYMNDPLIFLKPTFQSIFTINQKASEVYQAAYYLDKPTLLLEGMSSYVVKNGNEIFARGCKKEFITQKSYANLKHDLYNDSGNDVVFKDLLNWIYK